MWWPALISLLLTLSAIAQEMPAVYHIKYVASDVVYIDAGSAAGLAEGMRLIVKRPGNGESPIMAAMIAQLTVVSVATTSAVCEISDGERALQTGDAVLLNPADITLVRKADAEDEEIPYAQIVEFKQGDPLDREMREEIPRPPLREVDRFTGRVAYERDVIVDRSAAGITSGQNGISLRFDLTRIGGSYWTLGGYWRARLSSRRQPASTEPLRDVMQRVYQFGLRYDGPKSRYAAGIGRLMVPWAGSLNTLDGGYVGRRLSRTTTVAVFAGSTPDPSSWNYDPDRELAGALTSFEAGQFETARYTSTVGVAVSRLNWRPERQFLFTENNLFYKRFLHIQHNLEADYKSSGRFDSAQTMALTKSFLTVRLQPAARVSFDLAHNYFRVLPTFDPRLVSSGLVDNSLFQGLSGSTRLELPHHITPYITLGTSKRSEDGRNSASRLYGLSIGNASGMGVRADLRYSSFQSTIGEGNYRAISVQKEVTDAIRVEVVGGDQRFASEIVAANKSRFVTANADWFAGRHVVLSFVGSWYRGGLQNYDQRLIQLGYRF
jgi:hypothetical protein